MNCMPPSNLGIVFGPNLMRQREIVPSLALLANMSFQAKAVEIMIAHVHDVSFNPLTHSRYMYIYLDNLVALLFLLFLATYM